VKTALAATLVLAAAIAAGTAGYVLGGRGSPSATPPALAKGPAPSGPVIYYRDPDGKPRYSAEPRKTEDGRPFRAVLASEEVSFDSAAAPPASPPGKRILYYRNPMGLPDVSPTPKKDSMGMDYIAVYEGEDDESGVVKLSPAKIQRSGVTSERASRRVIYQKVRAPGSIQLDERRISIIALRSEAFIESVENVTTGSEVRKGQPLLRLYSPAISAAAAEYAALGDLRSAGGTSGARQKLLNMAVPETVIAELERTRRAPLAFVWTAPRDGVVLERNVVEGMRVGPGDVLFRIADHSVVWAMVDLPETRLGSVAAGQRVIVRPRAAPSRAFEGKVQLVYPHLNAATRTARVRIELANHSLALLPDMYVEAEIETGSNQAVLSVPESAVLDSGDRQVVIVDKGDGRFEPRPVKVGARGDGYVEIVDGLADGDTVVTAATFLIDAESNLKAALKGLMEKGPPQ
jgi:Cu(I)/Ag(I) efflux system membrane fusion protein